MYTSLKFGESIKDNWGIINIYDKDSNPTKLIGVRGPIFDESKLDELLKTKKLIGISAYQNFPQPLINIHDQSNYKHNSNIFLKKYESQIILWCHCFKDPQSYIPHGIPLLLHSDSDQYNGNILYNLSGKIEKNMIFFAIYQMETGMVGSVAQK
jgi:hypothetical protein